MGKKSSSVSVPTSASSGLVVLLVCLGVTLGFLFFPSLKPGITLFLNDSPLGALKADYNKVPDGFAGVWQDLNWVGANGGSFLPSITYLKLLLLGPVGYTKFHAPIALLILGVCAWFSCRALGFSTPVSVLTGIAAALNMNVFSNACWGLSSRPLALATTMLAIGALGSASRVNIWIRCVLAGLAVGMGITEGADIGVIFSLFVAAFGFAFTWWNEKPGPASAVKGMVRVGVVALAAGVMAFHIIDALVFRAKVLDAVAAQQQGMSPEAEWEWATQWSLPKTESLRVIIPGLHGYRMDTPEGGQYWGAAGQSFSFTATGKGMARFSGAGEYSGILVVVIALFAVALSLRKEGSVYSTLERRLIWFWGVMAVVSLLLAWGHWAPFYRVVHALPYFSSFRNPVKWTHPLHLSLLLLFAYGLQGLWRGYLERPLLVRSFGEWWKKAAFFERRWILGSAAVLGLSVFLWMIYLTSTGDLVQYMTKNAVTNPRDVARFSQREAGLYLFYLLLSLGAVSWVISGKFAGARSGWATVLLGGILMIDLGRANRPWIVHYDYLTKYASNPVLQFLQNPATRERVSFTPFPIESLGYLNQIYVGEWMQQQFPYYNIPSLDKVQDPRPSPENVRFTNQFAGTNHFRMWELTSVKYMLGLSGALADMINQQADGGRGRFKPVLDFAVSVTPGDQPNSPIVSATTNSTGPFSVIEFSGALPRASLVTQWQSSTNDAEVLSRLVHADFKPREQVMVSGTLANPLSPGGAPGKAEMTSYSPKQIVIKTEALSDGVLMLTDKYDTDWKVRVDGQPSELLRCNYLMRGVRVPSGTHTVEFLFQPSLRGLRVSLAAIAVGLVLLFIAWRTGTSH